MVVGYRTAKEAAETIRELVQQQEEEAAPVLRAREEAARRFVRGLLAVAAAAEREASGCGARASKLDIDISAAEGGERDAIHDAEAAKARIEQATENITAVAKRDPRRSCHGPAGRRCGRGRGGEHSERREPPPQSRMPLRR